MKDPKLGSCPFCGWTAAFVRVETRDMAPPDWKVMCQQCGASLPTVAGSHWTPRTGLRSIEREAKKALAHHWNRE